MLSMIFYLILLKLVLVKDQVEKEVLGLRLLKCYSQWITPNLCSHIFLFRNLKDNVWMISEVSYALKIIKFNYEAWSDHWFPLNYHNLNQTTLLMFSSNMSSFLLW